MAKPRKSDEDVLSLLDSLGDAADAPPSSAPPDTTSSENEKELLGFLDDLVKQPSRSQTPRPAAGAAGAAGAGAGAGALRTSHESATATTPVKKTPEKATMDEAPAVKVESPTPKNDGAGWFGGLWNMGSAAIKTAEQKVKELQNIDEAKAWEETVRGNVSVLGKLGISSHNRPH
jgi:hypothetical protein